MSDKDFFEKARQEQENLEGGEVATTETTEETKVNVEVESEKATDTTDTVESTEETETTEETKVTVETESSKNTVSKEDYDSLLGKFEEVREEIGMVRQSVAPPKQEETPAETETPTIDPFAENFQEQLQNAITSEAAKLVKQKMEPLEGVFWNREFERQSQQAKELFGDSFSDDSTKYVEAMNKLPGLTLHDAHRIADYDRVLSELNSKTQAANDRKSVVNETSTAASHQETPSNTKTVTLSNEQASIAQKMGLTLEEYAEHMEE